LTVFAVFQAGTFDRCSAARSAPAKFGIRLHTGPTLTPVDSSVPQIASRRRSLSGLRPDQRASAIMPCHRLADRVAVGLGARHDIVDPAA
jgi:hypothetical protein